MSNNDNADGQEFAEDENGEIHCPFCKTTDGCDHLLLMVDLTFRHAEGGLLYDAFNARWSKIVETADDPDFDERESFDDLLQEVDSLADSELSSSQDGMPGMSASYNFYYCGSKRKSLAALKTFISNE
jgi:hypothetical protein